ncbi:MAG: VWA domain-containing protein [Chloroflexia bacterium]
MGILLPAALALLAFAIPIIILYMLRLRREDWNVSSSMLWRRALQDRTANAPWQRLRRNLLLLLQLLLLLLLVLGLARPFVSAQTTVAGNMVLVLDASASMQSIDVSTSRFDDAKHKADALIDSLGSESKATLVWAGPQAQTIIQASSDKAALHNAVRNLKAGNGRADVNAALTLAGASARQLGDGTVVLISDGAMSGVGALPQVEAKTRFISMGASQSNLAITSLSLREAPGGPQLFASLYNNGTKAADALLAVSIDGQLRESRKVSLLPGKEQTLTIEGLPLDMRLAKARLTTDDATADVLPADNTAWALRPQPPAQNILLVTESNGFLEKALNLLPGVRLSKTTPNQFTTTDDYGLTILDATAPQTLPGGNLLIFAPPNSTLTPVSGTIQYPAIGQTAVSDDLLKFVDLSGVHIGIAQEIITPSWARVLVRTTAGDPLMLAGETEGKRVVIFAFDLHQTDLPLQVAFPILVSNVVAWLQPQATLDLPPTLGAGDAVSIRALPEADEIVVTPPGDNAQSTTLQPQGQVSFAATDSLGVYTVQQRAKGQLIGEPEQFAVNLFSLDESNITPNPDLTISGQATNPNGPTTQEETPLEIWPWVLAIGLLVLALEWWVYNRPAGLRGLSFLRRRPSSS